MNSITRLKCIDMCSQVNADVHFVTDSKSHACSRVVRLCSDMNVAFNGAYLQIMQSQNDSDIDVHESPSAKYTPPERSSIVCYRAYTQQRINATSVERQQ